MIDLRAENASRGTIVVAEDDRATRTILRQVLTKQRFTVIDVENGRLACDAVRQQRPDVILLDWSMPVMNGLTAVQELKTNAETRGIPIVMLTTRSEIDERVVALEAGVQDFLTKPFHPRELIARIEQQLRWRRLLAVDVHATSTIERLTQQSRTPSEPNIFDRLYGAKKARR